MGPNDSELAACRRLGPGPGPAWLAVGLVALALGAGCAKRNDARVRSAWDAGAGKNPNDGGAGAQTDGAEATPGADGIAIPKEGWERVDELLVRALDVLTTAPSPDVFEQLAGRWCEVEPIPRETPHGRVRVCFMSPPVRVEGVALTLELSDTGIIGFVALDLTSEQSAGVATAARSATSHLCTGPWEDTTEHAFSSCVLDGGSTLAIGRLATGADASAGQPIAKANANANAKDRSVWQVSISILGAV